MTWQPDLNLVDSARAGQLDIRALAGPDRAWAVAGCAAHGMTAVDTAKALHCSLRLIRSIRAEPMTIVATYALRLEVEHDREKRQMAADRRAADMAVCEIEGQLVTLKASRDALITQLRLSGAVLRVGFVP